MKIELTEIPIIVVSQPFFFRDNEPNASQPMCHQDEKKH